MQFQVKLEFSRLKDFRKLLPLDLAATQFTPETPKVY